MDEIYANVDYNKSAEPRPSQPNHTGPQSSERRFHGAAVLCLGLLSVFLLAGLIGLSVHHHSLRGSAADLSTVYANLTERLQAERDLMNATLQKERNLMNATLQKERDLMNATLQKERNLMNSLTEMTKELDRLRRLSQGNKMCPAGWTLFSSACYFLSAASGSWDRGREDCRNRGAHLVVIDSVEEQKFLLGLTKATTWIGLSDRDVEGTWKWVDGTPLTLMNWRENQPDNGGGDPQWGEEDCVHIRPETAWNDRSCEALMQWICEKIA